MTNISKVAAVVAMVLGAGLAACETPTPYQPLKVYASKWEGGWGGFSDQKLGPGRFRVTFAGNAYTSRDTVQAYLLYRAAELTLAQGFQAFEMADRHIDRDDETYLTPDSYGAYAYHQTLWRPAMRFYGVAWNPEHGSYAIGGVARPGRQDIRLARRYEASTEIIMHAGPRQTGDQHAFDARQVMTNLGELIRRPS
jgi:hypothetical protein